MRPIAPQSCCALAFLSRITERIPAAGHVGFAYGLVECVTISAPKKAHRVPTRPHPTLDKAPFQVPPAWMKLSCRMVKVSPDREVGFRERDSTAARFPVLVSAFCWHGDS